MLNYGYLEDACGELVEILTRKLAEYHRRGKVVKIQIETSLEDVKRLVEHYARMVMAGANNTPKGLNFGGQYVVLWRKFRDGTETTEVLREELANLTLRSIPFNEPNVARVKIRR